MKTIAIYPGRFQPFGPHHFKAYKFLKDKFGVENTFIATSNKVGPKSPLTFNEKKYIIKQYGIPESQIIQVKNPYNPTEITNQFDPNNTRLVVMLGEKDAGRLRPGTKKQDGTPTYYQFLGSNSNLPFNQHGYVVRAPHISLSLNNYGELSGTVLRKFIPQSTPEQFKSLFGWYKADIYNMLKAKFSLQESFNNLLEDLANKFDLDSIKNDVLSQFNNPNTMSIADDHKLYQTNARYRELFDKDERGELTDSERKEMYQIYQDAANKKKVSGEINEIGDGGSKPYPFRQTNKTIEGNYTFYNYAFRADGAPYKVDIVAKNKIMGVGFTARGSYNDTNNYKTMFRVLSTIKHIVEDAMSDYGQVDRLAFEPAGNKIKGPSRKAAEQRTKLYLKYISKIYPNSKADIYSDGVEVHLNEVNLNEIGDGSAKEYDYKFVDKPNKKKEFGFISATFNTENETYNVSLYIFQNGREMDVEFETQYGGYGATNDFKKMFRVMATIKNIVEDVLKEYPKVKTLLFSSSHLKISNLPGGDRKRDKLYLSYIKKVFPNAKVTKQGVETRVDLKENLILEGGGFGHMSHPFGEMDLTFNDLEELIERALTGELNIEGGVQEKMDGQNLMVTYKDGHIKSSRNKTTLKDPMSSEELATKFSNRGSITKAFVNGMNDLEAALQTIGEENLNRIFKNGYRFLNVEILFPETQNVIYYGSAPKLILLGMVEFNENWQPVRNFTDEAKKLEEFIKKANSSMQGTFEIETPRSLDLENIEGLSEKLPYFKEKLNKFVQSNNLQMSDTVGDYYYKKFKRKVSETFPNQPEEIQEALAKRWAYGDKSYRMTKSVLGEDYEKFKKYDNKESKNDFKKYQFPLEVIFLELGVEVMSRINNFMAANPDETVQRIRKSIASLIKKARQSNDPSVLEAIREQLMKIQAIGGFDKIIPSEGIVFNYKGRIMKLTGTFAPINQLLGIFKYSR